VIPLSAAGDGGRFGGKAAQLAAARGAGLPVPDGWALGWDEVDALVRRDRHGPEVEAALRAAVAGCGPVAVRSSAVGEDSSDASFAGAHLTVLGRVGGDAVVESVREVHASAVHPGALAYRDRLAVDGAIRMGVVVQEMGEAVVSGLVTPDHIRASSDGRILESVIGEKDVAIRLACDGLARETPVPPDLAGMPCLRDEQVQQLHGLARACDEVYAGTAHDIEFAFVGGALYLLQRRPITHG
jgi:pyruvate,water dikinase